MMVLFEKPSIYFVLKVYIKYPTIENNKIRIQLNTKDDVEVILPVSNSNKK
jgi:septum formation topological specificity factor MinE